MFFAGEWRSACPIAPSLSAPQRVLRNIRAFHPVRAPGSYAKTPLRQKPERGKGVAGSSRHGTIPKHPLTKGYPQSDRSRVAGQDRSLLHCGSTPLFLLPAPV